jgi:hypothetical protein
MPFTDDELRFLRWHGLDQDDVYDGRYQSKEDRHDAAKREGKYLILTSVRCRAAGHRIRTRAGHCFQCDPLKLVYQVRHSKSGYVYVAGSLSGRVIKIGTARDIPQREGQLRAERYAGFADWIVLYSIHVSEAGRVEHDASARVPSRKVFRTYYKDGFEQTAIEVLKCSFSDAVKAVEESLGPTDNAVPWKARRTYSYEFIYDSPE